MIRSGLRQKQRGPSSICLLCRHRLVLRPIPRSFTWTSNRSLSSSSAAPNSLGLHATQPRASNQSVGVNTAAQNTPASGGWGASGGSWGGGGGAWGSGLKRDPELEAQKARDREAFEAKEREVLEAKERAVRAEREAKEREIREAKERVIRAEREAKERELREAKEREERARSCKVYEAKQKLPASPRIETKLEASPPRVGGGLGGSNLIRRVISVPQSPIRWVAGSSLPPDLEPPNFVRRVTADSIPDATPVYAAQGQPSGGHPSGSELLPWQTTRPQESTSQGDQRGSSKFWGEAETRFLGKNVARQPRSTWTSPPPNVPRGPPGFTNAPFRRGLAPEGDSRANPQATGISAPDPFRHILKPESASKPTSRVSPQHPRTNGDPWSQLQNSIEPDAKPSRARPADTVKSFDNGSNWDWAEAHMREAKDRPQPLREDSTNPAQAGSIPKDTDQLPRRNWEDRYDRPGRPERPEKKKDRSRQRRSGNEEEDIEVDSIKERRRLKAERKAEKERARLAAMEDAGPVPILLPEFISVSNLAVALGVKPNVFIDQMMELGFEDINKESILTGETAAIVAEEYGFNPTVEEGEGQDLKPAPAPEDPSLLHPRPPVVTIMGHVDHGKTTLLDWLRKSSVAAGEHGGITQHIGAFSVKMASGKQITFLDTPGHAAFVQMRQRGANVTDIAILVVAADDSVKPQTIEAIKHARAAKVPMIVAITKVDKPDANVEKVKSDLAGQGVEIEDYGGDVQVVSVSGKTGQGMDDLEENILLLSDIMDIRAETDGMAEGWVLESSIKPIGRAATILVKRGTLRVGDFIVAGTVATRIRSLRNEVGDEVDEAPPGTAIEVLGWKDPPDAGDQVIQAPNKDKADGAVNYRLEQKDREDAVAQMAQQEQERREREREKAAAEAAEAAGEEIEPEEEGTKFVNFTVKGDVHGSVEAVCSSIQEIGSNEVRPRILMSSAGQITESDIDHAAVSNSCIINFNNPVAGHIKRLAQSSKVRILDHNIIYHMAEDVKDVLSELLPPTVSTKVIGDAEILQVFSINVKGRVYRSIAGCRIRNGVIARNSTVRVLRNDEEIYMGPIDTLKQGKKSAVEVKKGAECGVSFGEWEGFMQGDQIQVIEEVVTKRRLQ